MDGEPSINTLAYCKVFNRLRTYTGIPVCSRAVVSTLPAERFDIWSQHFVEWLNLTSDELQGQGQGSKSPLAFLNVTESVGLFVGWLFGLVWFVCLFLGHQPLMLEAE